jgi:heme a synthase
MSLSVRPELVRNLALASVIGYALLIVTGGAVRLSGSGLGCPDWPSCYAHHLTAQSSIHGQIEFANRLVGIVVTVVTIAVFAASTARSPRRRDLIWLSGGLVIGVLGQIVIGGLVVLFKLNPYLVSLHFLLTIAILATAVVLFHRCGVEDSPAEPVLNGPVLWLSRLVLGVLTALLALGTVVTGSGPHAGGAGAKRYPIAFRDITEAHSTTAFFLIGMTLALLFLLHQIGAPAVIQKRAQWFLEVLFAQGMLGYTQYFLHDNAVIVGFHLAGATAAWCACLGYYLSLHRHDTAPGSDAPERAVARPEIVRASA